MTIKNRITEFFPCILLAVFISGLLGCDAPRNNPVDPENPHNQGSDAVIEGTVQSFSVPYTPIQNVEVYWENSEALVKTDAQGRFSINNIRPENGILIFRKDGFRNDTIEVIWGEARKVNFSVNLNKIPALDSMSIYTIVINNSNPPSQSFELFISAVIEDQDKDVDSVYVENESLNLVKRLDYNITEKKYQSSLSAAELGISDLEETIGLDFQIYVTDVFSKNHNVGSEKVTRVIKNQIGVISPSGGSIVDSLPVFTWDSFSPGYSFNYMLEVYTNDLANAQLVFRVKDISPESVSYQHLTFLPQRDYYWVLWVVDKFQNRARSGPSIFIVQ